MILLVAWRNVWRNKIRSIILISAMAVGLWGGIVTVALSNGVLHQMIKTSIETYLSHIQIHRKEFAGNKEINLYIPDISEVRKKIKKTDGIKSAAFRVVAVGMASTAVTGTGVNIYGINPEQEKNVTVIHKKIKQGRYINNSKRNHIVVGEKLARKLKVKVRSKIVLTFQDIKGDITAGAFRVAGIFKTTSSIFDESTVFVRSQDLARLGSIKGKIHEIALLINNEKEIKEISEKLKDEFPGLKVETWMELSPELDFQREMSKYMLTIFMIIILLSLTFGIVNTMLMAVLERIREIGMLMAVGMGKLKIFFMIVTETVFLSITGAIVGMVISYITIIYLGRHGIDLSLFSEGLSSLGINEILYPVLSLSYYPQLAVMVVITAVIASLYPAYKALKFQPATALRMRG